ncbi:fetuin B [Synchiropus splendidus]|uniref:fetuin B n=1 Tax=Synchiropus splendidus TaxID=270530 RepID=UPI00237DA03C|nr:fetuin B [Synchiropus splendidus]
MATELRHLLGGAEQSGGSESAVVAPPGGGSWDLLRVLGPHEGRRAAPCLALWLRNSPGMLRSLLQGSSVPRQVRVQTQEPERALLQSLTRQAHGPGQGSRGSRVVFAPSQQGGYKRPAPAPPLHLRTMARWALPSLLLTCLCVRLQGAPLDGMEAASCQDPQVAAAARLALREINLARQDGYVLKLHRLADAHLTKQGESGAVFYLRLQVAESNCSVLQRERHQECEAQEAPVIGVCKAAIFISRVQRVVRLYKYDCALRAALHKTCADCPALMDLGDGQVQSIAARSLLQYQKDAQLRKHFAVLQVTRASLSVSIGNIYNVDYTIQETTCGADVESPTADKCPLLDCEFTHRGFCRASQFPTQDGGTQLSVQCQIFESEAAEREKVLHAAQTDHAHKDTHSHDPKHDGSHPVDDAHTHDHAHHHTKPHSHSHSHEHHHGHAHDHVHAHHAKAHDHSGDTPHHHHQYKHADGVHTHEHDHELALDHEHKHAHLHEHEHHHHHHQHQDQMASQRQPQGAVRMLPRLDQAATLPAFPDRPAAGLEEAAALPLVPDPDIPGQMEPFIRPFPAAASAACPSADPGDVLSDLFSQDPEFKV